MNDYFNHDNPLTRHTLGRAEQVNSIFDAVAAGFDKLADPDAINQGRATYVEDTGAANAYVVALDVAPTSYVAGLSFVMKALNANTGASTVNVNGLGVKTIKRYDGSTLVGGDILPGMLVFLGYDGTDFKIIGVHGAESALAKDWANKTSGNVDGSEFSSKEYAQGSQASTGGSSKNWAQQSGAVTGAGANDRSAKSWSQAALTGATLGGSAKDWAQHTGSTVDGSEFSAKKYAQDASNSADAAATSEANAEGHFDTFRGIFYGPLTGDPALDPNGDAPGAGDWYFNTTTNNSRIYDGAAWADIGSAANLNTFVFTATGGETSLSGQDDNGNTLAYTAGFLMVHKNGALLTPNDDYTASNGSSITGLSALTADDVVVIDAFTPFDAADVLVRANNLSDVDDTNAARANLNAPSLAGGANANFIAPPRVGGEDVLAENTPGVVIQNAFTSTGAVVSTTATIPYDDTIPQITEGAEALSVTITPKRADSRIRIVANLQLRSATNNQVGTAALFRGGVSDSLGVAGQSGDSAADQSGVKSVTVVADIASPGATSQTFSVRIGTQDGATLYLNANDSGTRVYGGAYASTLEIKEYMP